MKTYSVWSGRMRLSNVKDYLAEVLNVPVAAIDLKLHWPNKGTLEELVEGEMGRTTLSELRDLWNHYR